MFFNHSLAGGSDGLLGLLDHPARAQPGLGDQEQGSLIFSMQMQNTFCCVYGDMCRCAPPSDTGCQLWALC